MADRAMFHNRIREALRLKAAEPSIHPQDRLSLPVFNGDFKQWLPTVGEDRGSQLELLSRNAAELKIDLRRCADLPQARQLLTEVAAVEGWSGIATHSGAMTDAVVTELSIPILNISGGYLVDDLERQSAGLTECDAIIAQTGSVLITARSAGGRSLSILPPHHVVLARMDQLVPDLPAAYQLLQRKYADHYPSLISLITGPSRTADIERVLVLGAHGPKKLTILLIDAEPETR